MPQKEMLQYYIPKDEELPTSGKICNFDITPLLLCMRWVFRKHTLWNEADGKQTRYSIRYTAAHDLIFQKNTLIKQMNILKITYYNSCHLSCHLLRLFYFCKEHPFCILEIQKAKENPVFSTFSSETA